MPAKPAPPRRRRSIPLPFGRIAEGILRPVFRGRGFRESAIFLKWEHIAGPRLAERTLPLKLSGSHVLTVRVEPAFALELQHQQPALIERIATVYGYRAVERMRLVQGPVKGRRRAVASAPPPSPTPADRQAAEEMAGQIRDPELRDALASLGATIAADPRKRRP